MGSDDDRRIEVRRLYLDVVTISVDLLAEQAVAARWRQASVLPGLTVVALAAHLAGSALLVERFLDAAVAAHPPISAEQYYVPFVRTEDRDSVADRRVREQSMALAAEGHTGVVERSRQPSRVWAAACRPSRRNGASKRSGGCCGSTSSCGPGWSSSLCTSTTSPSAPSCRTLRSPRPPTGRRSGR